MHFSDKLSNILHSPNNPFSASSADPVAEAAVAESTRRRISDAHYAFHGTPEAEIEYQRREAEKRQAIEKINVFSELLDPRVRGRKDTTGDVYSKKEKEIRRRMREEGYGGVARPLEHGVAGEGPSSGAGLAYGRFGGGFGRSGMAEDGAKAAEIRAGEKAAEAEEEQLPEYEGKLPEYDEGAPRYEE